MNIAIKYVRDHTMDRYIEPQPKRRGKHHGRNNGAFGVRRIKRKGRGK